MRRLHLLLLVLALGPLGLLAAPASAGGPTSALITDPTTGEAAGLYYSDDGYAELDRLLTGGEALGGRPPGLGEHAVNVTWLIHDVQVWRTQRVYLHAEGGPVVVTDDDGWRRASDGEALERLLEGVLSESGVTVRSSTAPVPEPVVGERVVTETAWWSLNGWRWLVPGVLVGAGGVLLLARWRSREREPRQVLVDVAP